MGRIISTQELNRLPFFAGLSHAEIKTLSLETEVVKLTTGEWLFHEGERAEFFYILLEGRIEIRISISPELIEQAGVSSLEKGDILGWSALMEPHIYTLGAVALRDCRLARFNGVNFCEMLTHHPAIGYKLMNRITQVIGRRLQNLRIRLASLIEGDQWQTMASRKSAIASVGGRSKPKAR
jgi:CRP-like cAMP-binding protein